MVEEYKHSVLVVLLATSYRQGNDLFIATLQLSLDVLGLPRLDKKSVVAILDQHKKYMSKLFSDDISDNVRTAKILSYLSHKINHYTNDFVVPELIITGNSWVETLAPHTWTWIHCTTRYIDRNGGSENKSNFIMFVEALVLCENCRQHYRDSITSLKNACIRHSLEDVYLALHTHINRYNMEKFVFDKRDINPIFSSQANYFV